MNIKLEDFLEEVSEKTIQNNQFPVLTSSRSGLFLQNEYFNKQVASKNNIGYKIIRRGEFTYRAMSDTGEFYPNMLECADVGIVSPAYPVFKISKDIIVPEYLKYYFRSNDFQRSIKSFVQGSTRASMKFGKMKTINLNLPNKDTQSKIIQKLDLVKFQIKLKTKELELLDSLIKARFVEMFDVKLYPTKPLSEIAKYWNGLTYKPSDVSSDGTIVLRSNNIQGMQLDLSDTVRVKCAISDKKMIKPNDILMCSRNGSARLVGKVALIPELKEEMSFGTFMMIIRSDYYPYLLTYFQLPTFRSQLSTGTTTINQITRYMLDKVFLPVPDAAKMEEFKSFVTQVNKSKFAIQKSLERRQFQLQNTLLFSMAE